MKLICKLKITGSPWIADEEKLIFGFSQGQDKNIYIDLNGNNYDLDIPYGKTVTGKELFHTYTEKELNDQKIECIKKYSSGLVAFSEGKVVQEIDDIFGCFGFQDLDGNVVIKPQYAYAKEFSHKLCPVNLNRTWYKDNSGREWYENHYGYINEMGKTVIPFIFDDASIFNKYGVAVVSTLEETYLIDTEGKKIENSVFPYLNKCMEYDDRYIEFSFDPDFCNEIVGLYDTKERKIFLAPKEFESFIEYDEDCINAYYNSPCSDGAQNIFLNAKGEPKYPWQNQKGFAFVNHPDELMNSEVTTTDFSPISEETRQFFLTNKIKYDCKYRHGLINCQGDIILPLDYDKITYIKNNLYACEQYGVTFFFENAEE